MVVATLEDAWQVGKSGGAILILPKPLKFLLGLRFVVIGCILVWTMIGRICRYIFYLVEWTGCEMIPLAMRVHLLVLPIIQA